MTTDLQSGISRRAFLQGAGGLAFCAAVGADGFRLVSQAQAATLANTLVTPWVRIAPDGTVTIFTAGAEMGQGSMTSLPLILAEEMDADWNKVKLEWAPADPRFYGYTFNNVQMMQIVGSRAVQLYYAQLRVAGAQVRKVLIANAAQKLGVDPATLRTEPGFVVNPAGGQRLSYGEIAAFGEIPAQLPAVDPKELKERKDFRLIGKQVARRDLPAKVNGTAQYAMDVKLPGMVYASTLHSPVHDATPAIWNGVQPNTPSSEPESWNDAEVKRMKGVIDVVKLPNGVAVAADSFERARAGRNALKVVWKKGKAEGFDSARAMEDYARVYADPGAKVSPIETKGDVKAVFAGAAKTFEAEFRSDYGYHAQMEPLNAVVRINDAGDRAEVWEGSQAPDASRKAVAQALGLKEEQVTFNQCYMGGGFGRRSLGDYAAECAQVAKAVRRPVKLIWTREEDIAQGMFRPQSFQCVEAAMDASGKVTGWKHCVVGDGEFLLQTGIRIPYYGVPNQSIERRGVSHGVKLKHWRAVGHVFNVFAIESMVDRMAADQGMDPIEFRMEKMGASPKARKVFEALAQMSDYKAPRPSGRAVGISITERSNSLGAGAVEVSLDRKTGKIRVHKVWVAVDGGLIVQPEQARHNVESAILYGLSSVLHERVTIKNGRVEQSNFHDYKLLRMSDLPEEMHVQFVDVDTRPTGLGEIGNPFIAPAIANAVFRLTGKRLAHLPFTPDKVLATLKA
ncbi:MAG: xanthine dehydrogenase family protein molybdopterin-binding subunit [Betaproteobacteria bacterium]|nr:xanthine dehydrogenase family protein molybdopterin-binding subunit [Betaproteobacteria bacterium]